jgi:hypothetical protein
MAPRIWHRSVDGALMRTDELIEWVSRCVSAVGQAQRHFPSHFVIGPLER